MDLIYLKLSSIIFMRFVPEFFFHSNRIFKEEIIFIFNSSKIWFPYESIFSSKTYICWFYCILDHIHISIQKEHRKAIWLDFLKN